MEAEDEDEEREDTPGLTPVSAAPVRQNAGDGPELAIEGEKPALDQAGEWEWARELERSLAETRAETETEAPVPDGGKQSALEALGWDGLVIPVRRQNRSTVLRIPGTGDLEAELKGAKRNPLPTAGPEGGREGGAEEDRGLERLYRDTARAARPAASALPVEQAGRPAGAEDPGRTAALTVDELDRAVRRDSRRYDGGLTLF